MNPEELLNNWLERAPEQMKWAFRNQPLVRMSMTRAASLGMSEEDMLWALATSQSSQNAALEQVAISYAEKFGRSNSGQFS